MYYAVLNKLIHLMLLSTPKTNADIFTPTEVIPRTKAAFLFSPTNKLLAFWHVNNTLVAHCNMQF